MRMNICFLLRSNKGVTECDAVDTLAKWYSEMKDFRGQSFDTIASTGGNGAIIHYKPKRGKDAKIGKDIFLLDAGCHYTWLVYHYEILIIEFSFSGTTDTTRTVHCGTPTDFQKECYTRVLQGKLNLFQKLSRKVFRSCQFDPSCLP